MTVPEIWRGQNRGRGEKKNERGQNHIASPTGIANKRTPKRLPDIHAQGTD